jgi:hypothetical protein
MKNLSILIVILTMLFLSLQGNKEVAQAADEPMKWNSPADGQAKDGKFVRTNAPALTFNYPPDFMIRHSSEFYVTQVFGGASPDRLPTIGVRVYKIEPGKTTEEALKDAAQAYGKALEDDNNGSDIDILDNKPIDDYKPYPAYAYEITWIYAISTLTTFGRSIAKDGYIITVVGTTGGDPGEVIPIFKSINLNP